MSRFEGLMILVYKMYVNFSFVLRGHFASGIEREKWIKKALHLAAFFRLV